MSATIILIITSSSTRKTEPRGGRVVVMMSVPCPCHSRWQIWLLGATATIAGSPGVVLPVTRVRIARQRPRAVARVPWLGTGSWSGFDVRHAKPHANLTTSGEKVPWAVGAYCADVSAD